MSKLKNNTRTNQDHSLSSCTSSSLSSDEEEIDARDLKPIKDYLSDRKELARQLFKSVKLEKIRMMLPQVLKQMDLSELEEWCVTELNGMSKARILSILNGKAMLESSDTSESDESGPSLEIISDTEEWLTDDDISTKENSGKGKLKKDKTKVKKNDMDKSNLKMKCNIKTENINKTKDIKIKKEDDKNKAKEGDSLLDLLELEMRARAIRALIRKEEDIIPCTNSSQMNNKQVENNSETPQDVDKAKENCRKQLERIISGQQSNKGEDEDVVLVIQPTPVVELLSSDSDEEGTRVNKKLKNVHATEIGKSMSHSDENAKNFSKTNPQTSKERRGTQEITGIHNITNITTKAELNEAKIMMSERNVDIKNNILSISISADNVAEKRKKSKKKSHVKSHPASMNENYSKLEQVNIDTREQPSDTKNTCIKEQSATNLSDENEVTKEEENKTKEKIAKENEIEEERATDLDEIIDLDDYCDVVIGNCDEEKSQDKIIAPQQEDKQPAAQATLPKSDSMETWASRYYQTDDVQNVIKESKIQSDIRKRLRERQRLSKLNKSLNLNSSSQSSATDATVTSDNTPTGSVEEYLALKRATAASVDTNNSNSDTIQDNSSIINSNNDINAKEISVQDESNSVLQECTNDDVQKAIVPETINVLPESTVINDTKDDTQSVPELFRKCTENFLNEKSASGDNFLPICCNSIFPTLPTLF